MRAVAQFAMRGPAFASFAAALFGSLALTLPPLLIVSGAIVALVTLRQGAIAGLNVVVFASILSGGLTYVVVESFGPVFASIVVIWLPAWLSANVLRISRQASLALACNALMVGIYALVTRLRFDDVNAPWREKLTAISETVTAQGGQFLDDEQIALWTTYMHEASLVGYSLIFAAMILWARWWQSVLFNPGGFREEFHCLMLPRGMSMVTGPIALLALIQALRGVGSSVVSDLLLLLVVVYAFQGLAVVHHRTLKLSLARGWLIGLYLSLVFMTQVAGTALVVTGIADSFSDFRRLRRAKVH